MHVYKYIFDFRWIRGYAKCVFDGIRNCPFLYERYKSIFVPTDKVQMVISVCKISVNLQTGEFFIGNDSMPLFSLALTSATGWSSFFIHVEPPFRGIYTISISNIMA